MCKSSEKYHANIPFFLGDCRVVFKNYSNNLCPNQVNTSDANYQDDTGLVNKIVQCTQDTPHRWKAKAMAMEVVALLNIFTIHTQPLIYSVLGVGWGGYGGNTSLYHISSWATS